MKNIYENINQFKFINIDFESVYSDDEMKMIVKEIKDAVEYVFEKNYYDKILNVNITKEKIEVNGDTVNGKYVYENFQIIISTKTMNDLKNIKKLRNTICHELTHMKFILDNLQIHSKKIEYGDIPLYYINEFWACKISNKYSKVPDRLKILNKIFNSGYLEGEFMKKNTYNNDNQKLLADKICNSFIENCKNKRHLNLYKKLKNISFTPSNGDIYIIRDELLKLGFKI